MLEIVACGIQVTCKDSRVQIVLYNPDMLAHAIHCFLSLVGPKKDYLCLDLKSHYSVTL